MTRPRLFAAGIALAAPLALPAHAACIPLAGLIYLKPDPACKVAKERPDQPYLSKTGNTDFCYTVSITGGLTMNGASGFTTVDTHPLTDAPASETPALVDEPGLPQTLGAYGLAGTALFYTTRSYLDVPLLGRMYTAEAGVISGENFAEVIRVTGGTGALEGATGFGYTTGPVLRWPGAPFHGQVCLKGR